MSFWLIIIIILLAGIAGGYINYLLPSNTNADGNKIRTWIICIVLGIGASILVPLFLEIAQSKLMDNIRYSWQLQVKDCKADTVKVKVEVTAPGSTDTTARPAVKPVVKTSQQGTAAIKNTECPPLKDYFLFFGYCLLAAAAGIRFISSIMDSVIKDKQIAQQKEKIEKTEDEKEKEKKAKEEAEKAKEKAEKEKLKLAAQDMREAEQAEKEILHLTNIRTMSLHEKAVAGSPAISPVTNTEDRQKGRFGGRNENNGRKLSAVVANEPKGIFYDFTIMVESTDNTRPLTGEVILFLHDSFTPNVVKLTVADGKAVYKNIAYGAFTVGAVADNGNTLLELDLAEDKNFPKEFRER